MTNGKRDEAGPFMGFGDINFGDLGGSRRESSDPSDSIGEAIIGAIFGLEKRRTADTFIESFETTTAVQAHQPLKTIGCSCPNRDHDNAIVITRFNEDLVADIDAKRQLRAKKRFDDSFGTMQERIGAPLGLTTFDYGNQEVSSFVFGTKEARAFAALLLEMADEADAALDEANERRRAKDLEPIEL